MRRCATRYDGAAARVAHPTVAEADGSYTLQTKDLSPAGPASLEFQVTEGTARHDLKAPCWWPAAEPNRTTRTAPGSFVVGAQFRRMHRVFDAPCAPAQGLTPELGACLSISRARLL